MPRPADVAGAAPEASGAAAWSPAVVRRLLGVAVALGVAGSAVYLRWWLTRGLALGPWMVPLFAFAAFYVMAQIYCAWFLYLSVDVPEAPAAPAGLAVDVLVPVYDEPRELVERALAAAVAIRYPHRTHLLDD